MSSRRTTRTSAAAAAAAPGIDDASLSDSPAPRTRQPRQRKLDADGHSPAQAKALDKQKVLLSSDTGHFSLIRALHLADFITLMNGFCGVMSIFCSLRHCIAETSSTNPAVSGTALDPPSLRHLYLALAFLPFGLAFDFLDGRVARWRNKSSLMGQELDSLADLVSFGVAPAVVAFALGMRSAADAVALAFFVLCGLTRLARFNVTVQSLPKDASGKSKFFEGTPIPTTLGLDALMAFWLTKGWVGEGVVPGGVVLAGTLFEMHPAVLLFVVHGCFMTSRTIKIPKP